MPRTKTHKNAPVKSPRRIIPHPHGVVNFFSSRHASFIQAVNTERILSEMQLANLAPLPVIATLACRLPDILPTLSGVTVTRAVIGQSTTSWMTAGTLRSEWHCLTTMKCRGSSMIPDPDGTRRV